MSIQRLARLLFVLSAVLSIGAFAADFAHAQQRFYVATGGDDSNPCTTSAQPCQSIQGAYGRLSVYPNTKPSLIICLSSPGTQGNGFTISRAVTIDCNGAEANLSPVTVAAGPSDLVTLRGVTIWTSADVPSGIEFDSGAALVIENSTIRPNSGSYGLGINFQPSGVSTLSIVDSTIIGNGDASSGGGVRVATTGSGFARAEFSRVTIDKNYIGVAAVGSGNNASIEIRDSTISHNRTIGVIAVGSGASISLSASSVVGNAGAATSGNVLSYANNVIRGNNPDTSPASAGALR